MYLATREPTAAASSQIRQSCLIPDCESNCSSFQGVCNHVEVAHALLTAVSQEMLDSLNRWIYCGHLIQSVSSPLSSAKAPLSPGTGRESTKKGTHGRGRRPANTVPVNSPLAIGTSLPHYCPFYQCAQSHSRGASWMSPRELYIHINSVRISCGQVSQFWSFGTLQASSMLSLRGPDYSRQNWREC